MANQYTRNLDHISKEKFGKSAKELLLQYVEEGVTYDNAAKITGTQHGTIRKWCARYDIKLMANGQGIKGKTAVKDFSLLATKNKFQTPVLNKDNFLSRQWAVRPLCF